MPMDQIPQMLDDGIIEESKSPWRSPVVIVPKSRGGWRMCVDYRTLNACTKFDAYPMQNDHSVFNKLHGARYFTTIDMKSGYWQVSLRESDRELTAFSVGENLYQFKVLPFGVKNGQPTFQRLVEKVLKTRDCLGHICHVKMDDTSW